MLSTEEERLQSVLLSQPLPKITVTQCDHFACKALKACSTDKRQLGQKLNIETLAY